MQTSSPVITEIRSNIKPPVRRTTGGRGSRSSYPFEKLEVDQSFGVVGKKAKQLASAVSTQNKRNSVPKLDAAGNPIKRTVEMDGKRTEIDAFEMEAGKLFKAFDVDSSTDPDGASVRIFRLK